MCRVSFIISAIGKFHITVLILIITVKLLLYGECAGVYSVKVEANVKVGSSRAAFHIEHLQIMRAEILERIAGEILVNLGVVPG